ncbi:MAG TPA: type II toxin-antitoxin system VapC family toxin [Candidatus Xenobia bacterium]
MRRAVLSYWKSHGGVSPVARTFLLDDGVLPFTETAADKASELYRQPGGPRRRANDIAIATTALLDGAVLLTRNRADFSDIPSLEIETPSIA